MTVAADRQLRALGLVPRRVLGQHFLVDPEVVRASIAAAELTGRETVLEIGGGLGVLTEALATAAGRVVVVEQDPRLAAHLAQRFAGQPHVTVIADDVFRVRLDRYLRDGDYQLVANLPYHVTSLVFRNFLTLAPRPRTLVVLVQKEVADRLDGRSGNRSLLWLLATLAGSTEVLRTVDRRAFHPAPAVTSALVRLRLAPSFPPDAESILRVARLAFSGRRKQVKNSLLTGLKQPVASILRSLQKADIEPTTRPQELSLDQWRQLTHVLIDAKAFP